MLKSKYIQKQKGVSLIEILVTTLVLGIGLLGVASLQMASVSGNQEGFFTTQATSIAEDLASRIRAAKMVTLVPNSTVDHAAFVAQYVDAGELVCNAPPANMCRNDGATPSVDCSFEDIALFDRWEICSIASATLPQGKVRMARLGNRVTLLVDWNSISEKTNLGTKQIINSDCQLLTLSDDRNCVILEIVP